MPNLLRRTLRQRNNTPLRSPIRRIERRPSLSRNTRSVDNRPAILDVFQLCFDAILDPGEIGRHHVVPIVICDRIQRVQLPLEALGANPTSLWKISESASE